jgi:hypothetical protein
MTALEIKQQLIRKQHAESVTEPIGILTKHSISRPKLLPQDISGQFFITTKTGYSSADFALVARFIEAKPRLSSFPFVLVG